MNATEVAQNNFNSWNRHDADAINAAYAKGGTYRTPRVGQVLDRVSYRRLCQIGLEGIS